MRIRHLLSWILFISGFCFSLFSFVYPISTWYWSWIIRPPSLFDPALVSVFPVPKIMMPNGIYADVPLTDSTDWFPSAAPATISATTVDSFLLSLPSLRISDIAVKTNGLDLKNHPIHYPGTALPGRIGNTVILGHSALPQFYFFGNNLTVFNPLIRLKIGDIAKIDFAGITYNYKINKIFEVTPEHIEVLNQPNDRRQLTLITCVPFGTYLRRLVLVGELIN